MEILPLHDQTTHPETDNLGFDDPKFTGKVILATDLSQTYKQSIIFAFGENSAEVAIGYFPQIKKGDEEQLPRVSLNSTCLVIC